MSYLDSELNRIRARQSEAKVFESLSRVMTDLAVMFEGAERQGEEVDEPEGARYIVLSDTLAVQLSAGLRTLARELVK